MFFYCAHYFFQVISEAKTVTKHTTDLCKACTLAAKQTSNPEARGRFEHSATDMTNHIKNLVKAMKVIIHMYCKCGYFGWGKILRKCWQDISLGGNFHDTTHFSFIKAYGINFRVGVIFAKQTKVRKMQKLPARENFHVYSVRFKTMIRLTERFFGDCKLIPPLLSDSYI